MMANGIEVEICSAKEFLSVESTLMNDSFWVGIPFDNCYYCFLAGDFILSFSNATASCCDCLFHDRHLLFGSYVHLYHPDHLCHPLYHRCDSLCCLARYFSSYWHHQRS